MPKKVKKTNQIIKYQILCIFVKLKSKFKIFFAFTLLAVVLFAAVPKVYVHSLLGHTHSIIHQDTPETSVNEQEGTQDCNYEKFDTPVYYTVFKFILNFIPFKQTKETSFIYFQKVIPNLQFNTSPLRGPPIA